MSFNINGLCFLDEYDFGDKLSLAEGASANAHALVGYFARELIR